MSDEAKREPDADEPVIRVDKRQTRRQKREEEAGEAPAAEPVVEVAVEPEIEFEADAIEWPAEPVDEADAEASGDGEPADPFAGLNMYDQLRFLITMFNSLAWIHLGLQAPPGAGETRTDLPQARLAIDMIVVIKEKLGEKLSPAEHNEVETLLSNLRVNYLQRQSQTQGSGG